TAGGRGLAGSAEAVENLGVTAGRDLHPSPRAGSVCADRTTDPAKLEHVLVLDRGFSVRVAAREEVEHVGHGVEHGFQALDRAAGRAGQVADERLPHRAADAAGEHPEGPAATVAGDPHGFGEAGRLTLEHRFGAFGREVSGTEAGAPGGDDQTPEAG